MSIDSMIAEARAKWIILDLTLEQMEEKREEGYVGISMESKAALYRLETETREIVWNEILTAWLIANSVPENQWAEYEYDGISVKRIGD